MERRSEEFETGIVTGISGEIAEVQLNLQPACETCGAKVLCVPDASGKRRLHVNNPLHARVGSKVAIEETGDFLLKLSAIQYGIPFIGFILGILICYSLDVRLAGIAQELLFFLGGLTGLGAAALIARRLAERLADGNKSFFTITRILIK